MICVCSSIVLSYPGHGHGRPEPRTEQRPTDPFFLFLQLPAYFIIMTRVIIALHRYIVSVTREHTNLTSLIYFADCLVLSLKYSKRSSFSDAGKQSKIVTTLVRVLVRMKSASIYSHSQQNLLNVIFCPTKKKSKERKKAEG